MAELAKIFESFFPRRPDVGPVLAYHISPFEIRPASKFFVCVAGFSGAIAVTLGIYGSHVFKGKEADPLLKDTYEIANRYHFIHSLALLGVPFSKLPIMSGTLMTAGILVFCGSCYHHALTHDSTFRNITPYGAFLLIFGWASMML